MGRQVLVMLPEIALTENFLKRFEARFGVPPVLWHSSLKSTERRRAWRAISEGSAQVVVGARSARREPCSDRSSETRSCGGRPADWPRART